MDKELQDKIFNTFPEFFKNRNDIKRSLMIFGIETGNGWFDLIYNLCSSIKDWFMSNESRHYDSDYEDFVVKKGIQPGFQVVQVKEKFGGLRFYVDAAPQAIHDLIHKAESDSFFICERCGDDVRNHDYGNDGYHSFYRDNLPWVQTLCDGCLLKELERVKLPSGDYISSWQKKNNAPFKEG